MRILFLTTVAVIVTQTAFAATVRVPADHQTIQDAIDAATAGDTVVVSPGTYRERLTLKPGIVVQSDGDQTKGTTGLRRAEATIIDGGGAGAAHPGVVMAQDCILDGFTITNVGRYDQMLWDKHFKSHGEELGDDEGSMRAEGTIPAVSLRNISGTVIHCIVRHNGDVGIGISGPGPAHHRASVVRDNVVFQNMGGGIGIADEAEPIIRGNVCRENLRAGIGCRNAAPIITDNDCFGNIRAGIGCREGARPVIRGNRCRSNRRAGIGIRMEDSAPIVEANQCSENEMAGIGCRDGACPILRNNVCHHNKMAGIGCQNKARPLIVGNECRQNQMAGIGLRQQATALIQNNTCVDNRLVAVGVTEESVATILDNVLSRDGGQPPIIAVKDNSNATIRDNRITGGGVAAILVQGNVMLLANTFTGSEPDQGTAVWIWKNSTATVSDNSFDGYRAAVIADRAVVRVTGNTIQRFQSAAIIVKDSQKPAHIHGNRATSHDGNSKVVRLDGAAGIVADNTLQIE
ncbi:MAG: right-handed parallel beta-helix repeat-containing protein [Fuerstiella sp.]